MSTLSIQKALFAFVVSAMVVGLGCDGSSSSPTAPSVERLSLVTASIEADGAPVGDAYQHGDHGGGSTFFTARLVSGSNPGAGHYVYVHATPPGGMGGMGMWGSHQFQLWDDGTHGDPVAGDGVYCLEDFSGEHGFHHAGARHGEYHYEFWGAHRSDFAETNHIRRTIRVED